jgi:dienelactone hydrolase
MVLVVVRKMKAFGPERLAREDGALVQSAAQRIDLALGAESPTPHQVMVDQTIHLRLSGFSPGELVTIRAVYTPREGTFRSHSTFVASDDGRVDVATQRPSAGTYDSVDAMGLFWSMQLDPSTPSSQDNRIELTALQGEQPRAKATVQRLFVAPDVRRTLVREEGLYGTLFTPPGDGPHPGLLVLGGSGGGLPELQGQMFATHGYAAFALAYIRYEGLPAELLSIPLEYFETALKWMQDQPVIRSDQIGVHGISKGGELALLLGATFPQVKAVVGVVPSGVVWQGLGNVETGGFGVGGGEKAGLKSSWSHHGQDLPFVPFEVSREFAQAMRGALEAHTPVALTPHHLHSLAHADSGTVERATISVERTHGPILLVSGEDDQLWPSSVLADVVVKRLDKHRYAFPYEHLSYPGAGHLITIPHQPTTSNAGGMAAFKMAFGGSARCQAVSVRDAWTKILGFLAQYLPPARGSANE